MKKRLITYFLFYYVVKIRNVEVLFLVVALPAFAGFLDLILTTGITMRFYIRIGFFLLLIFLICQMIVQNQYQLKL